MRLFIGFVALAVAVVGIGVWAFLHGREVDRVALERCNAAGMRFSKQTVSHGKWSENWRYCVDREGFIKEIP